MGANHGVIIAHNLSAEELPSLPTRLNADAAPALARAVRLLARANNRITAELNGVSLRSDEDYAAAEEPEWIYVERWRGVNLDSDGQEIPPPPIPHLAPGER